MVCASLPYIHIIAPEADKVHSTRSLEDTIAFKDIAFLLSFLLFFLIFSRWKLVLGDNNEFMTKVVSQLLTAPNP